MAEGIELELLVQEPVLLEITTAPEYHIHTRTAPAILEDDYDEYPDDDAAKADGLEVGDWYIFSENSDVGPSGVPKRIMK